MLDFQKFSPKKLSTVEKIVFENILVEKLQKLKVFNNLNIQNWLL